MSCEGLRAYNTYMALKLHFTTESYDYFKFAGKVKSITENKLKIRKDYLILRTLERRYKDNLADFIVANMIDAKLGWSGDLTSVHAEKKYLEWQRRLQSLSYILKTELSGVEFKGLTKVSEGEHPRLLKLYIQGKVSPETMIALDSILGFIDKWDKEISDPIVWPEYSRFLRKYKPFVPCKKTEIKAIVASLLDE